MSTNRLAMAGCHSAFLPKDKERIPFSGIVERTAGRAFKVLAWL